jgi:effector-binding domain-containing protein
MPRSGPAPFWIAGLIALAPTDPVAAQVPAPQPVETKELAPLPVPASPGLSAPASPEASSSSGSQATTAAPSVGPEAAVPTLQPASPFLVPPPADPGVPDQVTLASRPAVVLKGESSWEEGYEHLTAAFRKLEAEAKKGGLAVNGKPVTLFTETDDQGFRYEALLPVERLPAQRPADMASEVRLGGTPEGRAIRFVHQAPYEEIDTTYEAITAYLDLKGIEVKETLIEEYANLGKDASDPALEVFIYVQPRK